MTAGGGLCFGQKASFHRSWQVVLRLFSGVLLALRVSFRGVERGGRSPAGPAGGGRALRPAAPGVLGPGAAHEARTPRGAGGAPRGRRAGALEGRSAAAKHGARGRWRSWRDLVGLFV